MGYFSLSGKLKVFQGGKIRILSTLVDTRSSDFQTCVLKQNICKKRYFNSWFESSLKQLLQASLACSWMSFNPCFWLHAVFQIACCRSSRCPIDPLLRSSHALHTHAFFGNHLILHLRVFWAKSTTVQVQTPRVEKPSINEGWELVDKHTNILTLKWDRSDKSSVKHPTSPQWGQPQEPAIVTWLLIHSPLPASSHSLTELRNHLLPKNLHLHSKPCL